MGSHWHLRTDHAKLHRQAEDIHDDPGVFDSAFDEAVEDHAPDFHLTPRSGDAEERALVGARPFKAGEDLNVLGNLFFHGKMQVGKCVSHTPENVFEAIDPRALPGKGDLFDYILSDILCNGVNMTPVDSFFDEAADLGAVLLC